MSVPEGDAGDDLTRVNREPPQFPSVTNQPSNAGSQEPGQPPLFTGPVDRAAAPPPPEPANKSGGGGRLRWAVAGLATILVLVLVGGALVLARPQPGAPSALAHYVPADVTAYFELSLDLPGDQRTELAQFMSHFPGFADQASFDQKLDESLAQLLASSDSGLDWETDVKPWFAGSVAAFGSTNPSADPTDSTAPPEMVIALGVSDQQKLEQVIADQLGSLPVDSQDYQGFTIRSVTPEGSSEAVSFVVTDDALLISPLVDQLKAALDTKAGQSAGLAQDDFFTQQLGALHADRLATVYYDMSGMVGSMPTDALGMLPSECLSALQSGTTKYVGEMRAQSDHMAFSVRSQVKSVEGMPAPVNRSTNLAEAMPADTLAYVEMRQVGATLGGGLDRLLGCLSQQSGGVQGTPDISGLFQQFLGSTPSQYFDFISDAGLGVSIRSQDQVSAGIVATVDDETVAQQRVDRLLGLIGGFGSLGSGLTTEKIDHNGVSITRITLSSSESGTATPGMSPTTLDVAVANGRLYLGVDDFVAAALDRQPSDSLATSDSYKKALSLGSTQNAGFSYLDVAGLRGALEATLPAEERSSYESEAKPFLQPLTTLVLINHVDGDISVGDGYLFVE